MLVVLEYGGRTPEQSNAALHITQDTTSIEKFKVQTSTYLQPMTHMNQGNRISAKVKPFHAA